MNLHTDNSPRELPLAGPTLWKRIVEWVKGWWS